MRVPAFVPTDVLSEVTLIGDVNAARLVEAITEAPTIERTIDGASTLSITVADHARTLTRSGIFDARSWAVVDGVHLELAAVRKTGDAIALTFEDAIVAALRRRKGARTFAAGSTTRAGIAGALAAEAQVALAVDPAARATVAAAIERKDDDDSWTLLGQVASDAGWRRFSDGASLVIGSDAWLAARHPPTALAEGVGGVHDIDFDLDVGQPAATATVAIDTDAASFPPGVAVTLSGLGPGDGAWLVSKFSRAITRQRASLELTRAAPTLDEAPPEPPTAVASDRGEVDFTPDAPAPTPTATAGAAASGARERFVAAALSKRGQPYIWGGTGPRGYDCSGLVQHAAAVAGKPISRVVSTQWADAGRRGQRIGVDAAIRTRGAVLTRLGGYGDHTAISLGNGQTIEARGRAYPIGSYPASASRGWTGGYLWV